MAPKRKTRRGRPPKGDFHNKSAVFSTRITPETRAAIEAAADASGRSISQEVEQRLKDSFRAGRTCLDKMSDHAKGLAILVGILADRLETLSGLSWRTDDDARLALQAGVNSLLARLTGQVVTITSWDEAKKSADSACDGLDLSAAQQAGISIAHTLLYHLFTARFPDELPKGTEGYDEMAALAWIQERLGLQRISGDWGDVLELSRRMRTRVTVEEDEEKKS
jgi:hypothetical protein